MTPKICAAYCGASGEAFTLLDSAPAGRVASNAVKYPRNVCVFGDSLNLLDPSQVDAAAGIGVVFEKAACSLEQPLKFSIIFGLAITTAKIPEKISNAIMITKQADSNGNISSFLLQFKTDSEFLKIIQLLAILANIIILR